MDCDTQRFVTNDSFQDRMGGSGCPLCLHTVSIDEILPA